MRHGDCTHFFTNSAEFSRSAKLLNYFAINDIHAEIYFAVVYFSDSIFLNQIFFCDYMDTDLKLGKFHTGLPSNRAGVLGKIASAAYKIET